MVYDLETEKVQIGSKNTWQQVCILRGVVKYWKTLSVRFKTAEIDYRGEAAEKHYVPSNVKEHLSVIFYCCKQHARTKIPEYIWLILFPTALQDLAVIDHKLVFRYRCTPHKVFSPWKICLEKENKTKLHYNSEKGVARRLEKVSCK